MNKKIIACLVCLLFAAIAAHRGFALKDLRVTDIYSESQAYDDALSISQGKHRYGLVNYTHYPNGPSYMLVLPMKMGFLDKSSLRSIPVAVSVICLTILVFGLVSHLSHGIPAALSLIVVTSLLWQPGVIEWMGSLHEHAYALALCFAGAGLALLPKVPRFVLLLVAFIQGWIGYDFTFAFFMTVLACRWLVHTRLCDTVLGAVKSSIIDGFVTGLGTIVALATHFMQNVYYFGSYQAAINDLFGSAAARAGLEVAKELNLGYVNWLASYSKGMDVTRIDLIAGLTTEFFSDKWIHSTTIISLTVMLVLLLGVAVTWKFMRGQIPSRMVKHVGFTALGALVLALIAGVAWIMLMPQHARYHFFFIPRHFFAPLLIVWITMCSIIDRIFSRQPST